MDVARFLGKGIAPVVLAGAIALAACARVAFSASDPVHPSRLCSSPQVQTLMTIEDIREAEQRLSELGYWTGPVDGKLDEGSRHALIAFQKVEGRKPTGKLTAAELEALRTATRPIPIESGFAHVEIDVDRQVLFIVDGGGNITKILPVSTGTGKPFTASGWTRRACTPCGRFTIYRKVDGWRRSPLGLLYYPNYINGGIAIHGNLAVPAYPASHGCIRIPMFAAKEFSETIPIGTVVIIHEGPTQDF